MASFSLHRIRVETPCAQASLRQITIGPSLRSFPAKALKGIRPIGSIHPSDHHGVGQQHIGRHGQRGQKGSRYSSDGRSRPRKNLGRSTGSSKITFSKQTWGQYDSESFRALPVRKRDRKKDPDPPQLRDVSPLSHSPATSFSDQGVSEQRFGKVVAHAACTEQQLSPVGAGVGAPAQAGSACTEKTIALLRKAQQIHPRIFASVAVLLLIGSLTGSAFATPNVQLTILALGVAILGVPHGALDLVTAQGLMRAQHWPWPQRWNLPVFATVYTACTALVVFLWYHFPGASLAGLLAASAWHFGTNDAQGLLPGRWHWVEVAARGLGPIALPFVLYKHETSLLFSHLAPPAAAGLISQLCTLMAFPTALAVAATSLYCYLGSRTDLHVDSPARKQPAFERSGQPELTSSREPLVEGSVKTGGGHSRESRLNSGMEMAFLGLGCTLAPPLLGFFLAFCTLHSLRHTLAFFADDITPASVADLRYVGTAAGIVTAVTLVVALAVFAGLLKHPFLASHVAAFEMASVQVIFVGLAALTAPHMVLLEFSRQRRRLRMGRT